MIGPFERRHHDDEIYDDISIKAVPRFKTSGLSGDEWRVSYAVVFKRKGTVLLETSFTSLDYAVKFLPSLVAAAMEGGRGFDDEAWRRRIDLDAETCAQIGCAQPREQTLRLKEIFAANGEGPLPASSLTYTTGFCAKHSERGDCGREDADRNYEPADKRAKRGTS